MTMSSYSAEGPAFRQEQCVTTTTTAGIQAEAGSIDGNSPGHSDRNEANTETCRKKKSSIITAAGTITDMGKSDKEVDGVYNENGVRLRAALNQSVTDHHWLTDLEDERSFDIGQEATVHPIAKSVRSKQGGHNIEENPSPKESSEMSWHKTEVPPTRGESYETTEVTSKSNDSVDHDQEGTSPDDDEEATKVIAKSQASVHNDQEETSPVISDQEAAIPEDNGGSNGDDINDDGCVQLLNASKSILLKQFSRDKNNLLKKKKKLLKKMEECLSNDPEKYNRMNQEVADVVTQLKAVKTRRWELNLELTSSISERKQMVKKRISHLQKELNDGITSAKTELNNLQEHLKQLKGQCAPKRPIQRRLPTSMAHNVKQPLPILDNKPDSSGLIYMNHGVGLVDSSVGQNCVCDAINMAVGIPDYINASDLIATSKRTDDVGNALLHNVADETLRQKSGGCFQLQRVFKRNKKSNPINTFHKLFNQEHGIFIFSAVVCGEDGELGGHCAMFNSRAGFGYLGDSTFGCYEFDKKDREKSSSECDEWMASKGFKELSNVYVLKVRLKDVLQAHGQVTHFVGPENPLEQPTNPLKSQL